MSNIEATSLKKKKKKKQKQKQRGYLVCVWDELKFSAYLHF